MKRYLLTLLVLVAALALSGCGGVGSAYRGPTDFGGSFIGFWNLDTDTQFGTMTLTVADDATVSGVYRDLVSGKNGALSGEVDREGHFSATVSYTDSTQAQIVALIQGHGDGDDAGLSGDGTYSYQGTTRGLTFDVNRSANSRFAGTAVGQYKAVNNDFSGDLTLTVATDGRVTGTYHDLVNAVNGSVDGAIQSNGKFHLVFKPTDGGPFDTASGLASVRVTDLDGTGIYTKANGTALGFTFNLFF